MADPIKDGEEDRVVHFPHSRTRPPGGRFRELGLSQLARRLGGIGEQATGHWCSRCQGVWFGFLLEAACPVCGNRHG